MWKTEKSTPQISSKTEKSTPQICSCPASTAAEFRRNEQGMVEAKRAGRHGGKSEAMDAPTKSTPQSTPQISRKVKTSPPQISPNFP